MEDLGRRPMRGAAFAFQQAGAGQEEGAHAEAGHFGAIGIGVPHPIDERLIVPELLRKISLDGWGHDEIAVRLFFQEMVDPDLESSAIQFYMGFHADEKGSKGGNGRRILLANESVGGVEHLPGTDDTAQNCFSFGDNDGYPFHLFLSKITRPFWHDQPLQLSFLPPSFLSSLF